MLYAIISDIHANLEALTAVLQEIDRRNAGTVCCLGDIVGYGADPDECAELIRSRCSVVICGNHDAAVLDRSLIDEFTPAAKAALLWTSASIKKSTREYLAQLPFTAAESSGRIIHGVK